MFPKVKVWFASCGFFRCVNTAEIHAASRQSSAVMPKSETTKSLFTHAAVQVNAIVESLAAVAREMMRLAALLPEYSKEFLNEPDISDA